MAARRNFSWYTAIIIVEPRRYKGRVGRAWAPLGPAALVRRRLTPYRIIRYDDQAASIRRWRTGAGLGRDDRPAREPHVQAANNNRQATNSTARGPAG